MIERALEKLKHVPTRAAVALGLLLMAPSLAVGWFADDWMLRHALRVDGGGLRAALRLYQFTHTFPQPGVWFASPGYRMDLLRPLAGLLLLADDRLGPLFGHLHSLAWWALLLAVAARLYRRLLPAPVAALALVLFAVDDAHWGPVVWIANRHALVATTLVLAGLDAQLRERRAAPAVLYALGLAASEAAVQALAYVAVLAVAQRRFSRLAAPALLVAAYAALRGPFGAGIAGSGQYLDPLHDPLGFLGALPARLATLLGDLLGGLPSDLWASMPAARPQLVALGIAATAAVAWLTIRCLRPLPEGERRTLAALSVGGLLALVPGAAGLPGGRLLFASSFASAALVAALLVHLTSAWRWWLLAVHLAAAPLLLLLDESQVYAMARRTDAAMARTELVGDVALVAAPDSFVAIYPPYIDTRYRTYRILSLTPHDLVITRPGPRTLRFETVGGPFFDSAIERSLRPEPPPGAAVRQDVVTAVVESPTAIRFEFDAPPESIRFVAWRGGALAPLALPAVGGRVTVRREPGLMGM